MPRKYRDADIEIGLTALCQHGNGRILSCADIAEVCGCSAQAISSIESKARNKLKNNFHLKRMHHEVMSDE